MTPTPTAPSSHLKPPPHRSDPLHASEIRLAASAVRSSLPPPLRFNTITLTEPSLAHPTPRSATVIVIKPDIARSYKLRVSLPDGVVTDQEELPEHVQPSLTMDDCVLAEAIVKRDAGVVSILAERYGVEDVESGLAADPWSVHVTEEDEGLTRGERGVRRLVQLFLYRRFGEFDNHYAHPVDLYPVVDLHEERVVAVYEGKRGQVAEDCVNYHADLLSGNKQGLNKIRKDLPKPLNVIQPDGPSFQVNGREITWQKWRFRLGFDAREGVILRDVTYDSRSILRRAALVEMAVPYADPRTPFIRKCAFDVGDYGLGVCSNSLKLGCDCLGAIHYFDAVLNDSTGGPYTIENAICLHEEDTGILYKHVEYRTGHSETRRARRLVISFVATVVNYEYLFYWYLNNDGSLSLEIKLSGELSTNTLSHDEPHPTHGLPVAPQVNAQIHQHMFCARLDMAVDGPTNSISETNFIPAQVTKSNPVGNAFNISSTPLRTELEAQRDNAPGRTWRIYNPHKRNRVSGRAVAYKLVPQLFGSAQPALLTAPESAVSKRGRFASRAIWVTQYDEGERYPAGEFPLQGGGGGVADWSGKNRGVEDERLVVWHAFGVAHMPRCEDFPVMMCESVGFGLRPDCFFEGNVGIDLVEERENGSVCCS